MHIKLLRHDQETTANDLVCVTVDQASVGLVVKRANCVYCLFWSTNKSSGEVLDISWLQFEQLDVTTDYNSRLGCRTMKDKCCVQGHHGIRILLL